MPSIEQSDTLPVLEEGVIEIDAIGFQKETKWYTAKKSTATFSNAARGNKTPVVNLEDFTIGLLMRVNGGLLAGEHQVIGLQAAPIEGTQNVRIWLDDAGQGILRNVSIGQPAIGARDDLGHNRTKLTVGEKEWHWVHIVFESGDSVTSYIDGMQVSKARTSVRWNKRHDMELHSIFSNSRAEQHRTCNCSIAVYRVYDRVLNPIEIEQNVGSTFAVDAVGKLATTWAKLKREF